MSKSEFVSRFETCVSNCEAQREIDAGSEGWGYMNHAGFRSCEQECEQYAKKEGRDRKPDRAPRSSRKDRD